MEERRTIHAVSAADYAPHAPLPGGAGARALQRHEEYALLGKALRCVAALFQEENVTGRKGVFSKLLHDESDDGDGWD